MVEIQIEDKKYDVPTEWKDITLEWWCGLYNILKKYSEQNTEEQTEEEKIDEKVIFHWYYQLDMIKSSR